MDKPIQNSLFLKPITAEDINEINKLDSSTGPNSIPIKLLKMFKNYIAFPLERLFNLFFFTGIVPEKFKLAFVIPVFKRASQTNVCNYRSFSLISNFNCLLERLAYKSLIDFISYNNVYFENQFGFRGKHSTSLATISIIDKVQNAIKEVIIPASFS